MTAAEYEQRLAELVQERDAAVQAAARALAHAEDARATLAGVIDSAPIAVVAIDRERRVRMWNRHATQLFGWEAEEVLGRAAVLIPPDRTDERDAIIARVNAGETIRGFETMRMTKSGKQVQVSVSVAPLPESESPDALQAVLLFEDVSARRKLLASLSDVKRQLRALVDGIDDVAYYRDLEGGSRPIFSSARVRAVLGLDPDQLARDGDLWLRSIHPEDAAANGGARDSLAESGESVTAIYRFRHGTTHEWIWIEDRMTPRVSSDGRPIGVFGVARDVTERKRTEEALARAQRDREELAGLVVHDLKSPLSVILSNVRFAAGEDGVTDDARAALADAEAAAHSLTRMMLNLLDVSRSEDGRLHAKREDVDLPSLLRETCFALRHRAAENAQQIEVRGEPETTARVDRDLVRRTVENLLDNCMKYGGRGTRIVVEAAATGSRVRIAVSDEGPGIPPEMRERIFEKNVRLDRDSERHARTSRGLGLTFCRLAALAHGGTIHVEDAAPRGARFVVSLDRQVNAVELSSGASIS